MKHFTIAELCASTTAARLGIDNTPNEQCTANLIALVDKVLDPLRDAWRAPIIVTSGYRCPQLNKAVGGTVTSHHLRGMAADITVGDPLRNKQLFQLVRDLNLPFCQLIDERGYSWLHISYDPNNKKRQVLHL